MRLARAHWPLLALIAFTLLLALPTLTYPLGRDQGEFATIGRGLLEGRIPYRDLWNPKPPAVFYLYAAAMSLFGRSTEALRALDLVFMPGMMLGLYWLGLRLFNRRVGLWAALLLAVFYFSETFWTLTQNDGLVLLPMILAVACIVEARHHARRGAWLLLFSAGALAGIIFWFKYPFALFIGLLLLLIALQRRAFGYQLPATSYQPSAISYQPFAIDPRLSTIDYRLLTSSFPPGLALTGLGFALYLVAIGAWPDLVESARVTSQYTALTFNWAEFSGLLGTALGFRWSHWGLLAVLALIGLFLKRTAVSEQLAPSGKIPVPTSSPATSHQPLATLSLWLLTALAIMLVQAKAYDYHWLPMLPPLALLGGVGVHHLVRLVKGRDKSRPYSGADEARLVPTGRIFTSAVGGLLLASMAVNTWGRAWPYLSGQIDQRAYYAGFQAGEFIASESLEVADYLRGRVAPGDTLTIWGFRPEIYYLSGLNPATRFIFQFPLVGAWYPLEWQQEHVDGLWAAMPPYAIVAQVDYMPWVTGSDDDSNTLLQRYTELNNWLIANYERDAQIGNLFVWRRKS
jgi:hypothetical protein